METRNNTWSGETKKNVLLFSQFTERSAINLIQNVLIIMNFAQYFDTLIKNIFYKILLIRLDYNKRQLFAFGRWKILQRKYEKNMEY